MLTLVAGPPAVGKTTLLKSLGVPFVDFDDHVRARFPGTLLEATAGYLRDPGEEWADFVDAVRESGAQWVADCAVTAEERAKYPQAFGPVRLLWLTAAPETLLARNARRPEPLPPAVMLQKILSQETPTVQEGFMAIFLKKMPDGSIAAIGDAATLRAYGGTYDAVISEAKWRACDCVARLGSDGAIVLGLTEEELAERNAPLVRAERDRRLRPCDKMSPMRWEGMSEAEREAWRAYRQALLDIPQAEGFPWTGPDDPAVPWPVRPGEEE